LSLTKAKEGTGQRSHRLNPRPSWRGGSPPANGPGWARRQTWRCVLAARNAWDSGLPRLLPKTLGGQSDLGRGPLLIAQGYGTSLSMAPGLDGVANVMVIADPMACGGTPWRKVMPSLLPRLGALGPWPVKVVARGVTAAPHHLWGVSVGAPSIGSGCHLGQPGERGAAPRG
jgi:hypothetical protein